MCDILIDDFSLRDSHTADAELMIIGGDDTDFGNPVPRTRVIQSALEDGQITVTDGHDNRTFTVGIVVKGPTSDAIADLAAKMDLANYRPRKLTVVPCDNWGAATMWRIWTAELAHVTDDVARSLLHQQVYRLSLEIEPHGSSVVPFTVQAAGAFTPVTIWDVDVSGSTGWVASGGTLAYSAGNYVGVDSDASLGTSDVLTNASLSVTPNYGGFAYLDLDWTHAAAPGDNRWPALYVGGQEADLVYGSGVDLGSGWWRYRYVLFSRSTLTGVEIRQQTSDDADNDLRIAKLTQASSANLAAPKLQSGYVDVPGSRRTPGSFEVVDSEDLGHTFIYTCEDLPETQQYAVELRQYYVGGGVGAADTTQVSGRYHSATTQAMGTYRIPVTHLPEGAYHLVLRCKQAQPTINWAVGYNLDGLTSVPFLGNSRTLASGVFTSGGVPYTTDGFITIANNLTLPPQALSAESDTSLDISVWSTLGLFQIDFLAAVWLGNPLTGVGVESSYTILEDRHGGSDDFKVVRIQGATPDRPVQQILVGTDSDFTDLRQEQGAIRALGRHHMHPGYNRILVGTTNASSPTVQASGYAKWQTWAVSPSRWRTPNAAG